jgi:hypothetical protein
VRDHHDALASHVPGQGAGGTARLNAHLGAAGGRGVVIEVPAGSDLARHAAILDTAGVPYDVRLGNGFDAAWVTAGGAEVHYNLSDCAWAPSADRVFTAGSAMLPPGDFMGLASEWLHFLDRAAGMRDGQ